MPKIPPGLSFVETANGICFAPKNRRTITIKLTAEELFGLKGPSIDGRIE